MARYANPTEVVAKNPKLLTAFWLVTLLLVEAAPVLADGGKGGP
ncbi:hypothetical protein [Halorussus halophilus]|nr:hypothetical protein [Halorussus halophilus]